MKNTDSFPLGDNFSLWGDSIIPVNNMSTSTKFYVIFETDDSIIDEVFHSDNGDVGYVDNITNPNILDTILKHLRAAKVNFRIKANSDTMPSVKEFFDKALPKGSSGG